jgi:hypothetical protein
MRGARLLLIPACAALGWIVVDPPAGATAPPPTPVPTTTVPADGGSPGPATTTPATTTDATSTTVPLVVTPVPRAGSAIGDLDRRRDDESWDYRRLATAGLLGIAALALAGHVYGRWQSITPDVGRTVQPGS